MLKEEGQSRLEMGRKAFEERVWQWKAEYGGFITQQMRQMGASCDWSRERFTLDSQLSGEPAYDDSSLIHLPHVRRTAQRLHHAADAPDRRLLKSTAWQAEWAPAAAGGGGVVAPELSGFFHGSPHARFPAKLLSSKAYF